MAKDDKLLKDIKKAWNWIWNSDSFLSWIVALLIIFIAIKFIFFPTLSFIMGTSLPLAGVESSSMDHQIIKDDSGRYNLCGREFDSSEDEYINFNEYWTICGEWYQDIGIEKESFNKFSLKNGFRKGDIIIVWGRFTPKIGDVIIFRPNIESTAPRPIVHRIVDIENEIIQTKGDHNERQLTKTNNLFRTDETKIHQDQVVGKAIIKIPYLGWIKIWATDLINYFMRLFA